MSMILIMSLKRGRGAKYSKFWIGQKGKAAEKR